MGEGKIETKHDGFIALHLILHIFLEFSDSVREATKLEKGRQVD